MIPACLKSTGKYFIIIYTYIMFNFFRNPADVLGFSKETVVALITNIEGREWHRRESINEGLVAEHPRTSTTDDVECFFSSKKDTIGQNFTTKQVKFGIQKVYSEFIKHLDPDLPFFIIHQATSVFTKALYPVSTTSQSPNRKSRESLEENSRLPLHHRRATMPVRGTTSVQPKFHYLPLEFPPCQPNPYIYQIILIVDFYL